MEFFAILILIAVLVLIVGSIMGIVANSRISGLERQIKLLNLRLEQMQRGEAPKAAPAQPLAARVPVQTPPPAVSKPVTEQLQAERLNPQDAPQPQKPFQIKARSAKAQKPKKARRSFEEELGARWAVWVGGIALLLGAVFLLRYTIEAGFFTPSMRIAMASLLGLSLLGGSEWLRRSDKPVGKTRFKTPPIFENSYIPGVLAGVGIFTLLATVYAAYQLYDFIGPIVAFGLMALISIGALLLGLLHGPWISALGLVASFSTPLLVHTNNPSIPAVFGYLAIISLVSWALARFRQWGWLDLATLAGGLFWLYFAQRGVGELSNFMPWFGFMGLGLLASTVIAAKPKPTLFKLGEIPLSHTPFSSAIWAAGASAALIGALHVTPFFAFRTEALVVLLFVAALIFSTVYSRKLISHMAIAVLFVLIYYFAATISSDLGRPYFILALILAAAIGGSLFWLFVNKETRSNGAKDIHSIWLYVGAFSPVAILWAAHEVITGLDLKLIAGTFATLSALLILAARHMLAVRDDQNAFNSAYPWAAGLAFWLAAIIWQDGLLESLSLIAGTVLFTGLYLRLKWVALRWIALAFAGVTAIQVILLQLPEPGMVSARPFMNELWLYLALPALICFGAGMLFERSDRDLPSEGLKAAGLVFFSLFLVFQIRHYMHDGEVFSREFTFSEIALQVVTGLCFTLGGVFLNLDTKTKKPTTLGSTNTAKSKTIHLDLIPVLLAGISYLTLAVFAFGLCLLIAPLFNRYHQVVGGPVFNDLIIAYALPAILMIAILWLGRDKRPEHYIRLIAMLALTAIMFYVTSEIRRLFTGSHISIFRNFPEGLETYVISASWLLIGIGLLIAGIKTKYKPFRLASALIITLTVLKAFLVDMATLEGVLRAMSFVILGIVLIVIGRVYQKLLFEDGETIAQKSD